MRLSLTHKKRRENKRKENRRRKKDEETDHTILPKSFFLLSIFVVKTSEVSR